MADFRQELRPASFRGIAFEMVDDDGAGARRVVTHEFPGRDEPFHEDLGAAVRSFSFRAVVIGDGYVARAAALEQAFLQAGAASLVHPHYGDIQVVVKDARRAHTISAIGQVEFSVTVEKQGADGGIGAMNDTARKLSFTSDAMFDLVQPDFLSGLAQGSFPSFVEVDGIYRLNSLMANARNVFRLNGLRGLTALPIFDALGLQAVTQVVDLFKGVVGSARPREVPIIGAPPAVVAENAAPVKTLGALVRVASESADSPIVSDSPSRRAIVTNAQAVTTLVQTVTLAAAVGVARYASYDSRELAIETRDLLAGGLSELRDRQLVSGLMPAWRATTDAMVAVTEDINERIGRLPRTVRVKGNAVRPSLALANRLYGDDPTVLFARAADIVKRNGVAHPGFVGARALEVLIDG